MNLNFAKKEIQFHINETQIYKKENEFTIDFIVYLLWTQVFELVSHNLHLNNIQVIHVFLYFMMHEIKQI